MKAACARASAACCIDRGPARLATLTASADKLGARIGQNAAISQAARFGGSGANVVSLYTSLMQAQVSASSTFTLSSSASSLSYPGVLATSA